MRCKRLVCMLLLLSVLSFRPAARAAELNGMAYDLFVLNYEEDVSFINNNTGRHMLALQMSEAVSDIDPRRKSFQIIGDVLSMTGQTDSSGKIIESLTITLTLPEPDLQPGTLLYSDFQSSGFHSYALLMAMDAAKTADERYALVTRVEGALDRALKGGSRGFVLQVGSYELTAEKSETSMTLSFVNSSISDNSDDTEAIGDPPVQEGSEPTDGSDYTEEDDDGFQG